MNKGLEESLEKFNDEEHLPERDFSIRSIRKLENITSSKGQSMGTGGLKEKLLYMIDNVTYKHGIAKAQFSEKDSILLLMDGTVVTKGSGNTVGYNRLHKKKENIIKQGKKNNEAAKKEEEEEECNFDLVEFATLFVNGRPSVTERINICDISAGFNHVLALDSRGKAWGWGQNQYRQVIPSAIEDIIHYPKLVEFPTTLVASHVYARGNSSFAIFSKNKIISWGEINMYLNKLNVDGINEISTEFFFYEETSNLIDESFFKDSADYANDYITINNILHKSKDDMKKREDRKNQEEKLISHINDLKEELTVRTREKELLEDYLRKNFRDSKVTQLNKISEFYKEELKEIADKKNDLREEYNRINSDMIDLKTDKQFKEDLINTIDDEIEKLESEKNKNEDNNTDIINFAVNQRKKSKDVFRSGIIKNKQSLDTLIETKDKTYSNLSMDLVKEGEKENEIIKSNFLIDDMIQLINESAVADKITENAVDTRLKKKDVLAESGRIADHLMELNDELSKHTFLQIAIENPQEFTDQIIVKSLQQTNKIAKMIEKFKLGISESLKQDLKIVFDLINAKINLILEQDHLVIIAYDLLSTLTGKEADKFNQSQESQIEKIEEELLFKDSKQEEKKKIKAISENIDVNKEYLILEIIIAILRETMLLSEDNSANNKMDDAEVFKLRQEFVKNQINERLNEQKNMETLSKINDKLTGKDDKTKDKKEEIIDSKRENPDLFNDVYQFSASNDIKNGYSWSDKVFSGMLNLKDKISGSPTANDSTTTGK